MKPKTIIAILGVLALLVAFSSTARAGDEVAKSAMAQCIAERNALCERGDSDCMATGAAFCHAVHKNAFKVALDYTLMEHPDAVGATGKLLRTGEAKTLAVEKFAGDSLTAKAIVIEVSADGTVAEKEASISLLREPREGAKLVVVKSEAGGIIINPMPTLELTFSSEPACHSSHYFEDLLGEIVGLFDYEALVALFETIVGHGIVIPLEAIPDYDGDGFADDLLIDVIAASFTDEEWNLVIETIADFAALMELLIDLGIDDGTLEFEECIDGVPVKETYPDKAKAGAKKELIKDSAKKIVGEKEPVPEEPCLCMDDMGSGYPEGCTPTGDEQPCYAMCACQGSEELFMCPFKIPSTDICDDPLTPFRDICLCSNMCGGPGCLTCLGVCDFNNDGSCASTDQEIFCNNCNQLYGCDMSACPTEYGCYDPNMGGCYAPSCYVPIVWCECIYPAPIGGYGPEGCTVDPWREDPYPLCPTECECQNMAGTLYPEGCTPGPDLPWCPWAPGCMDICDTNDNGICEITSEIECVYCNTGWFNNNPCDLNVCPNGCYDFDYFGPGDGVCRTPVCYNP